MKGFDIAVSCNKF